MLTPVQIRERVKKIIQLPALSSVTIEIAQLLENPRTSAAQLGNVIATDQSLTAKVLKISNSPFYGFPKKISTIEFAIIILGFETLREIVMSVAMVNALQQESDEYFDAKIYWDHSISSAVIARRLARDVGYRISGEVFVAGLLHDMGISVLHKYFSDEFRTIIDLVKESDISYLEAEEKILGVTHAEIGGWLAERWNLPDTLVDAIKYHHKPMKSERNPGMTVLIHCADIFASNLGEGGIVFDGRVDFNREALQILDLPTREQQDFFIEKYTNIFKIDLENLKNDTVNVQESAQ